MEIYPNIIEITGPSGSGKSTLIKNVTKNSNKIIDLETAIHIGMKYHVAVPYSIKLLCRVMPIKILNKIRFYRVLHFFRSNIRTSEYFDPYKNLLDYLDFHCDKVETKISKQLIKNRMLNMVIYHSMINQPELKKINILADEFFLQKIFLLFFTLENKISEEYKAYLKLIPKPSSVIIFNQSVKTSFDRLKTRQTESKRPVPYSDTALRIRLESGYIFFTQIQQILKDMKIDFL